MKSCILRPSKFEKRPEFGEHRHPFVKNPNIYLKSYDRRVLIRWHLLLRLSLNPELTRMRKHLIESKKNEKKNSSKEKFISKVKKVINITCDILKTFRLDIENLTYDKPSRTNRNIWDKIASAYFKRHEYTDVIKIYTWW